jgi:hypothetical protein
MAAGWLGDGENAIQPFIAFATKGCCRHTPFLPFYDHLVFSTKDRRPFLRDKTTRHALHSYLGGVSKQLDCPPSLVGIAPNNPATESGPAGIPQSGIRHDSPNFQPRKLRACNRGLNTFAVADRLHSMNWTPL